MNAIIEEVRAIWGDYQPTPLIELPRLAHATSVGRVLLKLENERPLGNFKSLGGMIASLRALARAVGAADVHDLLERPRIDLPQLVCASDGNHGLAVAAAAQRAGAQATVFLPRHISEARARRITERGGRIVWIEGTYDDAVAAANAASQADGALLIADTSEDASDPVVADVMSGYGLIAEELRQQIEVTTLTHIFVQAGVGGLAAALAEGLKSTLSKTIVVEPANAACVAAGLTKGSPVRIPGDLATNAEMLSCGLASAPALAILRTHDAQAISVQDASLANAIQTLEQSGGPRTTPSGAAGVAGLLQEARTPARQCLTEESVVLLIVTEEAAIQ